jgi:predicted RNA-binding Zn-ribbon protein involved in translation (DUF1610 family)
VRRAPARDGPLEDPGAQRARRGDRPIRSLQAEIDAGELRLLVYVCPDCGLRQSEQAVRNQSFPPRCFECNGLDEQKQTLMDGKPMVPLEVPVRKLPDAFRHLDSSMRTGITERYIAKLVRSIDQQRQASIPVRDAGGLAHNARLILRFAAERAGVVVEDGAIRVRGDGSNAIATFFVDPADGAGAAPRAEHPILSNVCGKMETHEHR